MWGGRRGLTSFLDPAFLHNVLVTHGGLASPLLSTASCCRDAGGTLDAAAAALAGQVSLPPERSSCSPGLSLSSCLLPSPPLSRPHFSLLLLFLTSLPNSTSLSPSFLHSPSLLLLLGFLGLLSLGGNGGRERRRRAHTGQWRASSATHCSHSAHFLPPHLFHQLPALFPPDSAILYSFLCSFLPSQTGPGWDGADAASGCALRNATSSGQRSETLGRSPTEVSGKASISAGFTATSEAPPTEIS